MVITKHGKRLLGHASHGSIEAMFHYVCLFELKGLVLSDSSVVASHSGFMDGMSYSAVLGNDVYSVIDCIDVFKNKSEEIISYDKLEGFSPVLALHVGPTDKFCIENCEARVEGEIIVTYDAFNEPKQVLISCGDKLLASLLPGLYITFSNFNDSFVMNRIGEVIFGIKGDGGLVFDEVLSVSAKMSVTREISGRDVEEMLQQSIVLSSNIEYKPGKFYEMAVSEKDSLKKFLYFFLCIEVKVNLDFDILKKELPKSVCEIKRNGLSVEDQKFLSFAPSKVNSVAGRFVWCLCYVWSGISLNDLEEFKVARKLRNEIAHGSMHSIDCKSIHLTGSLAAKVLSS